MNIHRRFCIVGLLLSLFICTACSGDGENGNSTAEERARETGRQAAEQLKANIEAAESIKQMSADRLQSMEESTEQQ